VSINQKVVDFTTILVLLFLSTAYLTIFPAMISMFNIVILSALSFIFIIRFQMVKVSYPLVALLFINSLIYVLNYNYINMHSFLVYSIAMIVILLSSTLRRDVVYGYVKTYVLFCFILSLGAIASFIVVNILNSDICQQISTLESLTDGRMKRDLGIGQFYHVPCNFGLVENYNAKNQYAILGFNYYRVSAWSHEPVMASFYISPALIIVYIYGSKMYKSLFTQWLITAIIFVAIFMAIQSLTAIISLLVILFIYHVSLLSRFSRVVIYILLFIVIVIARYYFTELTQILLEIDSVNILREKLLYNKFYLEQFKNLPVLILILIFMIIFLIEYNSKIIRNGRNFNSALLLCIVFSLFYVVKLDSKSIYALSFLFRNLSFILWLCLYSVIHIENRRVYPLKN
jgi:MFS family permease